VIESSALILSQALSWLLAGAAREPMLSPGSAIASTSPPLKRAVRCRNSRRE
jgi:hypothetical protein